MLVVIYKKRFIYMLMRGLTLSYIVSLLMDKNTTLLNWIPQVYLTRFFSMQKFVFVSFVQVMTSGVVHTEPYRWSRPSNMPTWCCVIASPPSMPICTRPMMGT